MIKCVHYTEFIETNGAVVNFILQAEFSRGQLMEYIPVEIECWGKKAKFIHQHLKNNRRLAIVGSLRINKQQRLVVNADTIDFLSEN